MCGSFSFAISEFLEKKNLFLHLFLQTLNDNAIIVKKEMAKEGKKIHFSQNYITEKLNKPLDFSASR